MNQARTLQHIAALAVGTIGLVSAAMLGTRLEILAIFLIVNLSLFLLMRENPARSVISVLPEPAFDLPDLTAMAGFRTIVEGLSEPVLVVDHGKVALANSSARKLLGAHIVGEDIRIAIRHPAAAERLTSTEMLPQPLRIDIIGLGNRNQRWAMGIIPFDQEEGRQKLFVHLTDESGLHAAERLRGDFVANASHELRTPLAAILGFLETLQDPETGGDAKTRERFLSILHKEARRMQQLVDDLMSLSRIEADKYRLPETPIEMASLVEEVLSLCRQNLGNRGQDIIAAISDDIPATQGDRTQISQLLHNLVSNSAKYGRPGTPITVRLTPAPPSMIRLEVCDEGEGIPSDHLPRLTERFYRVDSGRSRAIGGTGLGLAIVKHIVERHRGRLDISSIAGKGTTVSVLLPAIMQETPDKAINTSNLKALS